MNIFYVGLILLFLSCTLACFIILLHLSKRKDPVNIRLKNLQGQAASELSREDGPGPLIKRETARSDYRQTYGLRAWLSMAGYRQVNAVYNYNMSRVLAAILIGAIALVASLMLHLNTPRTILLIMAGLLGGSFIPRFWVMHRMAKRKNEIRCAVPNLLDLMVVCVEAGLSFTSAIQKLSEETRLSCKPLSDELRQITQEILIGKSKAEAFRNLANRTGVDELRSLAITLIQADKLGTSIANSLRVLADSMRFKRHQRAEEMANKTTVKLVFPLVLLIFPELMVILVGPALIKIVKTLTEMAH